ncbi:MAG: LEA type 2 family protein [Desulfobulbaceae bacterium]|nr:LEA type 2 family protein [Desulfobulbaceae bacterium]
MKKIRAALCSLLVVFLLSSCAAMQPVAPEINLMGLVVDEVTLSHVNMVASLRLFNPNDVTLQVEDVEYELELNGIKVSSGKSLRSLDVPANDFGSLDLRLSSAYWDLFRFASNIQQGEELDFRLTGKVRVGGLGLIGHTFNFDHEGKIPLLTKEGQPSPLLDPLNMTPRQN